MFHPPARINAIAETPVTYGHAGSALAHAAALGLLVLLPAPDLTRFERPPAPELNVVMIEVRPPEPAAVPPEPEPAPRAEPQRRPPPEPPEPPARLSRLRPAETIAAARPDFVRDAPTMTVAPTPEAIAAPAQAAARDMLSADPGPEALAEAVAAPDLAAASFEPTTIAVDDRRLDTLADNAAPSLETETPRQSASVDFRRLGPTPEEVAEEDARRKAAEAARRAASLPEGGKEAPPPASGPPSGSTVRAVIGSPPAGGLRAGSGGPAGGPGAASGYKGVFGPEPGCENIESPSLSEDQRARCLRAKWAGARGAGALGPVSTRDQKAFDAAMGARAQAREETVISCGDNSGAECLPESTQSR